VQRWRGLEQIPGGWGRSVVTIGVFDGVHRGHRAIIGRAVQRAREVGQPAVLVTFDPHPSEVVRPGSHPAQLTTTAYKADLLEEIGVDVMLVVPFTLELSQRPPAEFVHDVLVDGLQASAVVVGENFRFGYKAAGDITTLAESGVRFGLVTEGVPLATQGDGTIYSSTAIRTLIAAGEVRLAAEALLRDHRVEGLVVRGDQIGRGIGFPTANLRPVPYAAIPADGIYAGRVRVNGEVRVAAISVGSNPTFEGRQRRVEAYILDFEGDIYGRAVAFDFVEHLRGMQRYDDVEALVAQMHLDVARTRELVSS
jgi:riboflavin kinase/FMN adenylyltransferase